MYWSKLLYIDRTHHSIESLVVSFLAPALPTKKYGKTFEQPPSSYSKKKKGEKKLNVFVKFARQCKLHAHKQWRSYLNFSG